MRRFTPTLALSLTLLCACGDGSDGAAGGAPSGGAPSGGAPSGGAEAGADSGADPAGAEPSGASAAGDSRFAPGGAVADDQLAGYHAQLDVSIDGAPAGTLAIELWPQHAPGTVRNFLRLCDEGFYDGVRFHRVVRGFMVQGGDPTASGNGNSPHGTIQGEFSEDPARRHGYGVISMARIGGQPDSASCQFFVCCDETPNVWNLDGGYASFGRLSQGVATLEAIADFEPRLAPSGELSLPTKPIVITAARAVEGPAPGGETIERPLSTPDLGGEPRAVVFRHVLIAFQGATRSQVERTQEEALALAEDVLRRARAGEAFGELMAELSDDPANEDDPLPGTQRLRNRGVRDVAAERAFFDVSRSVRMRMAELSEQFAAGTLTEDEVRVASEPLVAEYRRAEVAAGLPRNQTLPGVAAVVFGLEVGEFGLCPYDPQGSPLGYHVLLRIE